MNYIYDVVLNFQDELIEFYEWSSEDTIDHIKRIPIFRVNHQNLNDLINKNITISNDFIQKIKNKTKCYRKTNDLKCSALFTDLNRVVGIEFSTEGNIIARSSLLLDEEETIILECRFDLVEKIYYKVDSIIEKNFLTRKEKLKRNYILKELDKVYETNNIDKLNYLYKEIYNDSSLSFESKYLKLKKSIKENYESKYNILYDILKLTGKKNNIVPKTDIIC